MQCLIPKLNRVQEDIFKRYIHQDGDNPIQTISTKGTPRRAGLTTIAIALAAAEMMLGKKVIIISDSEYQTNYVLKSFIVLNSSFFTSAQGKISITQPQATLAGLTADVIVYETHKSFSALINSQQLQNTLSSWHLWTRCEKIFTMHG